MNNYEEITNSYKRAQLEQLDKLLAYSYAKDGEDDFYIKNIAPNTKDFLRALAEEAVAVQFVPFYGGSREKEFERIFGGEEGSAYKEDNTYNYNEPWTETMCVAMSLGKKEDEAYSVAFARHLGGDVRGNYADFVVVTFRSFWDYQETVDNFFQEHAYNFQCDGRDFECYYNGAGEHFTLTEFGGEGVQSDAFLPEPWSEEDFLNSVREALAA